MSSRRPRMSLGEFGRNLWRILADRPQIPPALAGNDLLRILLNRRSVRRFAPREIPYETFQAVLEAGRLAPSTVNLQTWSFAVFTAETWQAAFGRTIPFRAQRAVIVMGDTHRNRPVLDTFPRSPLVEYTVAVLNASLAAMNMNIAAEALGVSSVMLSETGRCGLLDAGYLQETLHLPDGVFPLMTIVFGYPAGAYPPMPPKLVLEDICFTNQYREMEPRALQDWMDEMTAGYKANYPRSSFEAQLGVYQSKIAQAEADLQRMVFHEE
jgi:FMN reductase (NADPH)